VISRRQRSSRPSSTAHIVLAALLVGAAAVAGVGPAVAQSGSSSEAVVEERLRTAVAAYAEGDATLDVPARGQVVGPLNVYVTDGSATYVFSLVVTESFGVESFAVGARDDARRKAVTDAATIERVAAADNPPRAFERAIRDGDVRIVGEDGHPIEQLKWAIGNLLRGLFG
jgi:hypothetical protein